MAETVVIGAGFGGAYYAKKIGAPCLSRSNGYDLNHDIDKILHQIAVEGASNVVNFASQSMVGQSWENPADWMQTNCVGMTRLIQGLAKFDFLDRYVHFTTPEVYGHTQTWMPEHWAFAPSTPYAASRALGDWMVKLWHDQYKFPALFTRAANIYGPGQQLYRIIPKAILAKMEGKPVPLHGGGKSLRAFVHMDDVTRALNLLLHDGKLGATYHIGPRESVTIKQIVDMIGCETHDAPDRPGKDEAYLLDPRRIMDLGWAPKISLNEGIKDVGWWMEANATTLADWPREYRHAA